MKENKPLAAYANIAAPYVKPVYPHAHLPFVTEHDIPSTMLMQTLYRALRLKRDHGTMTEARFVAWLINRLPVTMIDGAGNVHVDTRTQPHHKTMFTSHTDTVHHNGGDNAIRLDMSDPKRTLWRADEGSCLGADDGAGIALMVHMIDRGVPGYYVFFRAEECGGLGSSYMADDFKNCIKDIDRCVSFDRADYSDVITHQGGRRCCSDTFAYALAEALTTSDFSLAYVPDNTGVFTDSANLTHLIPECTNLSVGYKHQHGDGEWQDVTFLTKLAAQLVQVDWDKLPVERDPKAKTIDTSPHWWSQDTTKGTSAPAAYTDHGYDMDAEYLADCLFDAMWGKRGDLCHAVADYFDIDTESVKADMLRTHEMERLAKGLYDGTYDTDQVYEYLKAVMYRDDTQGV